MNLRESKELGLFRQEARMWLIDNVPSQSLASGDTREGFAEHVAWENKLFKAGWSAVSWPKQFGGRDVDIVHWLVFEEEYYRSGAPTRVTQNGIFLLAPTLMEFGTEEQRERILPAMAAAEHLWCQGWSEPNAGSDLASIRSYAEPTERGWCLTGQKCWVTRGLFCDSLFGLFRTDPKASRHKGLSYFMVPLNADGVTVRGVQRLDGDEGFADVFFDSVFVSHEDVIGEVNQGWRVAMATTRSERGLTLRSPGRFLATARRLLLLCQEKGAEVSAHVRRSVVQCWMDAQAYHLYTQQMATKLMEGQSNGAESSVNKVFWSELDLRMHEQALSMLGAVAELEEASTDAVDDGAWLKGYLFALAGPIYAGTNEIQRNIIAERVLGLPRR